MASAIATFAKNNCMHPQNSSCRDEKGLVVQPFLAKKKVKSMVRVFLSRTALSLSILPKKIILMLLGRLKYFEQLKKASYCSLVTIEFMA